jgi:hypothetical protein
MADHRATWVRLGEVARQRYPDDDMAAEATARALFDTEQLGLRTGALSNNAREVTTVYFLHSILVVADVVQSSTKLATTIWIGGSSRHKIRKADTRAEEHLRCRRANWAHPCMIRGLDSTKGRCNVRKVTNVFHAPPGGESGAPASSAWWGWSGW